MELQYEPNVYAINRSNNQGIYFEVLCFRHCGQAARYCLVVYLASVCYAAGLAADHVGHLMED